MEPESLSIAQFNIRDTLYGDDWKTYHVGS